VHSALSLISSVVGDRRISSQKSVSQQQKKEEKRKNKKNRISVSICFFSIVEKKIYKFTGNGAYNSLPFSICASVKFKKGK